MADISSNVFACKSVPCFISFCFAVCLVYNHSLKPAPKNLRKRVKLLHSDPLANNFANVADNLARQVFSCRP